MVESCDIDNRSAFCYQGLEIRAVAFASNLPLVNSEPQNFKTIPNSNSAESWVTRIILPVASKLQKSNVTKQNVASCLKEGG